MDNGSDYPAFNSVESLTGLESQTLEQYDYVYYFSDLSVVERSWTDDRAFYPSTITYGLTFIFGILGNLVVVLALCLDRKCNNVTSTFMISLALADLLFLLVCVPYETATRFFSFWKGGRVLCKAAGFVEMLSALASVLNLTAVSLERYIVIVHPMKSRSWCTIRNTYRTIGAVWTVALILSSPTIYIMDTTRGIYHNNITFITIRNCKDENVNGIERILFAWYQLSAMFLFPVAAITYCYVVVTHVLWHSAQQHAHLTQGDSSRLNGSLLVPNPAPSCPVSRASSINNSSYRISQARLSHVTSSVSRHYSADVQEARKQIIRMLISIIVVFYCCWGPKLIMNVIKRHDPALMLTDSAFDAMLVINLLPYAQSCINPIIYCFMSRKFRRSMRSIFRRIGLYQCCPDRLCTDPGRPGRDLETTALERPRLSQYDMKSFPDEGRSVRHSTVRNRNVLCT